MWTALNSEKKSLHKFGNRDMTSLNIGKLTQGGHGTGNLVIKFSRQGKQRI